MLTTDLLHDALPIDCVCPNTIALATALHQPGISGTGFLARHGVQVFYFTAMHCLRSGSAELKPELPTLLIPIRHTGETSSANDFLSFSSGYTLEQYVGTEWQDTVDVIACEVEIPQPLIDREHLLGRCAKLPLSGGWLESFLASEEGDRQIQSESLHAVVVGFPAASENTFVDDDEQDADAVISAEATVLNCTVSKSSQPSCLAIRPLTPGVRFPGFSGSPVFARVAAKGGKQYALLGMVITGSSSHLEVLRLSVLSNAAFGSA